MAMQAPIMWSVNTNMDAQLLRIYTQISSVSDFVSCQFGADSAGYPIRQFPFPPGHKGWIARGCYIPLALPPSQRNLALRLHNAEGYYLPTYLPSSHCRLECRELGSPILKIDFGPRRFWVSLVPPEKRVNFNICNRRHKWVYCVLT